MFYSHDYRGEQWVTDGAISWSWLFSIGAFGDGTAKTSDIVELEPNLTSAQTKEPGALEPDFCQFLKRCP